MKRILLLMAAIFSFTGFDALAQTRTLKKTLELKMPNADEVDLPGKRGASVVWHPIQKKYYASFAGNAGFPCAVFDGTGKRLSGNDHVTLIDTRGLWYDPVKQRITGNGYDTVGWFAYKLDSKGLITDIETLLSGMNQPGSQCVGAYNANDKQVLFLSGSQVFMYSNNGVSVESVTIHWGRSKTDGASESEDLSSTPEDYNNTALVYTRIPGKELGFLNISTQKIELYDIKTGFRTQVLALPENAPVESSFNFAYANGIYWLFDMENRNWIGFK